MRGCIKDGTIKVDGKDVPNWKTKEGSWSVVDETTMIMTYAMTPPEADLSKKLIFNDDGSEAVLMIPGETPISKMRVSNYD